ncbi:MAG: ABC transporter permease [Lachnospiraceae bacterium]
MNEFIILIGKRCMALIGSLFLLSLLIFWLARMAPGDPLDSYYGERVEKMSSREREEAEEKLGLKESIPVQYGKWLNNILQKDFGISFKYKEPVIQVIGQRLGNTLLLGVTGFVLIFIFALLLGILCVVKEGRWTDKIICRTGILTGCIPEFWLALILMYVFCIWLDILPISGAYSIGEEENLWNRIIHLILPLSVMVLGHLWYYAYLIRNKLLQEVKADYVLLARAKGVSGGRILFRHCLPNILPSYLSLMAASLPHILGGTYVVETVFSYPGLGTLVYESARYKDYHLLMTLSILTGVVMLFGNFAVELINGWIDPRMRRNNDKQGREQNGQS